MTDEIKFQLSDKDLKLRVGLLPVPQRTLYETLLAQERNSIVATGVGRNVGLENRYEILEKIQSGEVIPPTYDPRDNTLGIKNFGRFNSGGEQALRTRPDIFQMED